MAAPAYNDGTANEICEWLASGRSLRSYCAQKGKPSTSMVCRWLADERYATFREQYARAREAQADAIFDECLHIADTPVVGQKTVIEPDGGVRVTEGDMIEHRRLQVDTRKWMASKLAPKKYGEKIDVTSGGQPMKFYGVEPTRTIFKENSAES